MGLQMARPLAALLVGFALLLGAGAARAEVESELVQAGVKAYDDLEYEKAITLLERAQSSETLTRDEKAVTYRTLGFCHVALGYAQAAREDFKSLLRVAPATQLDRTVSPRVRSAFEDAQKAIAAEATTPAPAAPATPAAAEPLAFTVEPERPLAGRAVTVLLGDPGPHVRSAQLFHRRRGEADYSRVIVGQEPDGRWVGVIPGMEVAAPALEYYVVGFDDTGAALRTAGSAESPLTLDVQGGAEARPVYKRAWFWGVLLGGVAAVGAAAVAVATTTSSSTPAHVTLMPQ